MELSKDELNNISGGAPLKTRFYILGGLITFFIGFLDGFMRPLKCN